MRRSLIHSERPGDSPPGLTRRPGPLLTAVLFFALAAAGTALAQTIPIDFGDAPPPYPTLQANGGASHTIQAAVFLGAAIDGEANGQPSALANGDDTNSSPGPVPVDDEDGVMFNSPLIPGRQVSVGVFASVRGFINAWIDFAGDGSWAQTGDQIFLNQLVNQGGNLLTFTVPSTARLGATFARFRYTTGSGSLSFIGQAPDGEVEDYRVVIEQETLDFGDAPQVYATLLANNGARHTIVQGLRLGQLIDAEANGQPGINADQDDVNPTGGLDDEDGVTFVSGLNPGSPVQVVVTASAAAQLDAFMDFNHNGDWIDPGEKIFVNVSLNAGPNTLTFIIPTSALTGDTYARFRLSSKGALGPGGPADDGEVEDYKVTIGSPLDFGDAPDNANGLYPTLLAHNGARHPIVQGFHLGKTIDPESDGQPNATSDGDDVNPTGAADDEDGVHFSTLFLGSGQTIDIDIEASQKGQLDGWIDFNVNANWNDATDRIFNNVTLVAGVNHLSFTVPNNLQTSITYARFRFSTKGGLRPEGPAEDGEVEDYVVALLGPMDFGDAPDPTYPTRLASDGARHVRNPDIFMGFLIDVETDGQPNLLSNGDDIAGTGTAAPPDDEDGVVFTTPLHMGGVASVDVRASTSGLLNAWIDWNHNGTWADPEDHVFVDQPLGPGVNSLTIKVPENLPLGSTFSRWRFSTQAQLSYTGLALNGEVEDHMVFLRDRPVPCEQSNKGRDFWLTFPANLAPYPDNPVIPVLTIVGQRTTTGTVSVPGLGWQTNFVIPASMKALIYPPREVDLGEDNDVIGNNGIHVTADGDVAVFGMSRVFYTTDGYLGLPSGVLGKRYIVQSYDNVHSGIPSLNGTQFALVACESNTIVTIVPSQKVLGHLPGVPFNITLEKAQTYQLRGPDDAPQDLSGTLISANKPIAVFGGHRCAFISDATTFFCDYIVEQQLPVERAGRNFVAMSLATRTGGDVYRVFPTEDKTSININGINLGVFDRGQFVERNVLNFAHITANKPVLVNQYAHSADFDPVSPPFETGDPFQTIIPSTDMYLNNYMVDVPDSGYTTSWINITIPTPGVGTVLLDGVAIPAGLYTPIGVSGYSGARVPVVPGVRNLATVAGPAGALPFGVIVYGWAEYDSFCYPGGMHFTDRTAPTVTCLVTDAVVPTTEGCFFIVPDLRAFVDVYDNCPFSDNRVVVTQSPPAGTPLPVGTNHVTIFATDQEGNTGSCVITIVVVDITPPGISCPQGILATCETPEGAHVTYTVQAFGQCGGVLPVTCNPPPGSLFPVGDTLVTCTTSNLVGQTTSCQFVVRVTCQTISISAGPNGGLVVRWNGTGTLQVANDPAGPWEDFRGATSPFPVDPKADRMRFFRVKF